jgi:hypothetical protein
MKIKEGCTATTSDFWYDLLDTVQECACCPESNGGHKYSAKTCGVCGRAFCYSCCGGTNVDQGGKHDPDYMFCPSCGADFYAPEKAVNA